MPTRHDYSPKALLKARRKTVTRRSRASGWTKKRAAAVEAIVWGGALTIAEAAKVAGMSERRLQAAFRDPEFLRHYRAEVDVQRSIERARNLHQLIAIRDDPELAKTASGARCIVEACKAIDALAGPVNVALDYVTEPSIVIDIKGLADEARKQADSCGKDCLSGFARAHLDVDLPYA